MQTPETVRFDTLKIGDKFSLWVLGSEIRFTKTGITLAETGGTAVSLELSTQVFPAISATR